jgi:hypothetical protein
MATTAKMQKKSLDTSPDETCTFEKGKIDQVNFGGDVTVSRAGHGFYYERHQNVNS